MTDQTPNPAPAQAKLPMEGAVPLGVVLMLLGVVLVVVAINIGDEVGAALTVAAPAVIVVGGVLAAAALATQGIVRELRAQSRPVSPWVPPAQ